MCISSISKIQELEYGGWKNRKDLFSACEDFRLGNLLVPFFFMVTIIHYDPQLKCSCFQQPFKSSSAFDPVVLYLIWGRDCCTQEER